MALYGGSSAEEDMPMDDMGMGDSEPSGFEPKDDEERAAVEAFPEKTFDENSMAALKEFVRLCAEKAVGGGYSDDDEKPPSKGGSGLALIFGEPKKKK